MHHGRKELEVLQLQIERCRREREKVHQQKIKSFLFRQQPLTGKREGGGNSIPGVDTRAPAFYHKFPPREMSAARGGGGASILAVVLFAIWIE